ncbi:MAG: hypothetical protein GEV09_05590 [Pseudonocardiaceae bacterium]|nr:hypothetical protein [Pseudonocardiaceae bacterium]
MYTDRWGWQPHAWRQNGLTTYPWRTAPTGLITRRQMRTAGLAPNRAEPVAQIITRRNGRRGYLYDPTELAPKRTASPAQLAALDKALAARRWCPDCRQDAGYCIPTSLGRCIDCEYPQTDEPADRSALAES